MRSGPWETEKAGVKTRASGMPLPEPTKAADPTPSQTRPSDTPARSSILPRLCVRSSNATYTIGKLNQTSERKARAREEEHPGLDRAEGVSRGRGSSQAVADEECRPGVGVAQAFADASRLAILGSRSVSWRIAPDVPFDLTTYNQ